MLKPEVKFHTTFRKKPDGSIELLETSICRMDDPDFRIEEPDGSILYRISGDINFEAANVLGEERT